MQALKPLLAILWTTAFVVALPSSAAARTVSGQVLGQDGKPVANAVVFVQEPASVPPVASSSPAIMDQ